ncbi:liprin-beta-2-like [Mercenaria mercenaria]|uniref:liprin-beta-2-like n=1 Tax=Mercenaria mercenaria TaxID=6596 RepID=UPI00234E7D2F|nr:liprin-beta-2-like [Mercenaria mercenaria]
MASGDSEDSGFVSVRVAGSQARMNVSNDGAGGYNAEMSKLHAVQQLNKSLLHKIQALKEEINGFKAEKNALTETHKRDIDRQKRETKVILAKKNEIQNREALHIDEIQKLKADIEFLEKTETELRDKIKMLEPTKYTHEYEKERRDMSASKAEIKKLKEQIAFLEKALEERDEHLVKTKEEKSLMAAGFDRTIDEMTKKHEKLEANLNSVKCDLLSKMEENKQDNKEMFHNLQELILARKEKHPSVERSPRLQPPNNVLPPINTPRSSFQAGSKSTCWKP